MYVVWKKRRTGRAGEVLDAILSEAQRMGKKVNRRFLMHLGTFREGDWRNPITFQAKLDVALAPYKEDAEESKVISGAFNKKREEKLQR
jgi:hypothetical protein